MTGRGLHDITQEELDRLARAAVDFRAARVYRMLVPLAVVGLLDPTLARLALLAPAAVALLWLSKRDVAALEHQGFTVDMVAFNARFLLGIHAMIVLVTGGLTSPVLPVLVVTAFAVTMLLGAHPSLRGYLMLHSLTALALAVSQATGLSAALSPRWMDHPQGLAHTVVACAVLLVIVRVASMLALHLRERFEGTLTRVADARADLLETHRAQAAELTALSGAIAHELKNPLASIKGLGALLARDLPPGKPQERLSVLRGEVDRMQLILEEFLTFSRPLVPTVVVPTDLRALADEVATLHEGWGRRVAVTGAGLATVDPRKTRQILINLVQNALEAAPADPRVRVHVRGGDPCVVTVDDDGPGPDQALGERLFDAGVTTKTTGNGLGLTIARSLARQQGGDLTLERRPDGGARATLSAPGCATRAAA
jgi:signal transduction histidine kinase